MKSRNSANRMENPDENVERMGSRQRMIAKNYWSTSFGVKITPPEVSGVIHRKRLFRLIDRYRASPLVWLSAPAGSGKSTLVADYLIERKLPCIWYRLDEGDGDIGTFFYYMGLAAKKAVPRKHRSLPLLPAGYPPGVAAFTIRFFELLFELLKVPFVLVFEDYQRVSQHSGLHEIIRRGVEIVPTGMNVIVLSRDLPHPAFARFFINGFLKQVGAEELGFNLEELKEFLAIKYAGTLEDDLVRRIYERTRGWGAGIMLMSEMAARKNNNDQLCDLQAPREMFDYFSSEVFSLIDPEIREFLQKTVFMSRISAPIAEKLTGNRRAGTILSKLHREHFFTEKKPGPEPVYQYHPLFRDFLVSSATATLSSHELTGIRRKAADLLMQEGYDIADWPRAVKIKTLGRFELLLGDKPATCYGKVQKKPLLLLKVLIALGGRDVKETQLTDVLWPEAEGDQAHSAFSSTVLRLRRLLGRDEAVTVRCGAVSLDIRYCWVDVWAFEAEFEHSDSVSKESFKGMVQEKDASAEFLKNMNNAIALYSGQFLAEEGNQPWIMPLRSRLRRKFSALVVKFGSGLEAAGQWERATEYYKKALETDEIVDEELYLRLMRCHYRLGWPGRAVEVYRQCRKALALGLAMKPSPKIEAFYRKLME